VDIHPDCDGDCLLVRASPEGPTCHLGKNSCFDDEEGEAIPGLAFLTQLESVITQRYKDRPEGSYTTKLLDTGIKRIAQKVGEEGVETALAAVAGDEDELLNESADLLYHLMVLLCSRRVELESLIEVLKTRHSGNEVGVN